MEDAEARTVFNELVRILSQVDPGFTQIAAKLRLVEVNMGASILKQLFAVRDLWAETPAFGVLDGDQSNSANKSNKLIFLPGGDSLLRACI
ncbi:hypothetical protein [Corynebacterium gottingense]|uniref:hypothetical protein n=1 Tax=Corynebacterium gottingense TaxID=2041036 RepID=UPI0025B5332F|nr:hypothetical protein [Corynebacterium gottingense]